MPNVPPEWIIPDWSAPENVKAVMTTRQGGSSQAPFDSMNLGDHVDDDLVAVQRNRASLKERLNLPNNPLWLTQVHGVSVVNVDDMRGVTHSVEADASVTHQAGSVCAVMTADCLPVLFCNTQGTAVAAAHAGWRGLDAGVLEQTVKSLNSSSADVIAWLGVAIGPESFEVGSEVREAFIAKQATASQAFIPSKNEGKWLANIYQLARLRLEAMGVTKIYGGGECSFKDKARFYSYRREAKTGRMASVIWMDLPV
ncbi:MAG TPA: peptidoglycan editing factor PgeF [Leucothrix mucor]|nr:peptidoglycan editing factor PgeF [Leucothrix mucor]